MKLDKVCKWVHVSPCAWTVHQSAIVSNVAYCSICHTRPCSVLTLEPVTVFVCFLLPVTSLFVNISAVDCLERFVSIVTYCVEWYVNPLKGRGVSWLQFAIHILPTFIISDIRALALSPERQSAQMSEIINGRSDLDFKGLKSGHVVTHVLHYSFDTIPIVVSGVVASKCE